MEDEIVIHEDDKIKLSIDSKKSNWQIFESPKMSNWKCYLFGCYPSTNGIIYQPVEDNVPNWFIRWMMKICLGCIWVKIK